MHVWQEFFSSAPELVAVTDCLELPFKDLVAVWEAVAAATLRQKLRDS